jgi:putative ABC transport system permease protein
MPRHAPTSLLTLTLAVALAAFPASLVRVGGWNPLHLESRLLGQPLPPADWGVDWTPGLITAQAQQDAAFRQLGLVILLLSLVGSLVALISFVALVFGAASAKRQELATREAVGATPLSLGRRLMWHALVLGGVALIAGVTLALAAVTLVERSWPHGVQEAEYNTMLLSALGVGSLIVVSGVALSSVLAYLAVVRLPLAAALTSGTRVTASRGELQLRSVLAAVQFAGVLTLLSGAATLTRQSRPETGPTTAQRDSLLIARVQLHGNELREARERVRVIRMLIERVHVLPAVQAETLSSANAWLGLGPRDRIMAECGECFRGLMYMPFDAPVVRHFTVMPNFFAVLGVDLEDGRDFGPADDSASALVVLVNRPLASAQFERGKPIGRHVYPYGILNTQHEIVGITPAIRAPALGGAHALDFSLYLSALQYPPRTLDLLVRVRDLEMAAEALSSLRSSLPAGVVLHEPRTANDVLRELSAPLRFLAVLLLGMALLVVLVGMHGAYALQRFRVQNQQRELSVRLAVGALPRSLILHVLGQTLGLVRAATVVGIFGALAAARGVQVLIPGTPPFDPGAFAAITLLLVAAALLGALLPAVRVGRLDPAAVLD